jgi:phosphoglycolate phosphatase-like HAD superfamily hydrolase
MGTFDNAVIERDAAGTVRQLNHLDEPFRPGGQAGAAFAAEAGAAEEAMTARELADLYLREAIPFMHLDPNVLAATAVEPETAPGAAAEAAEEGDRLVYHDESSLMGNTAVSYVQTVHGIPVWESGMVVQVEQAPMQVIGAQNTMRAGLELDLPADDAPFRAERIDGNALGRLMGFGGGQGIEISHREAFIYQYRADRRVEAAHEDPVDGAVGELGFALPPVADQIEDGAAYLVTAVQFSRTTPGAGAKGWLALVEAKTGSVLYLRSLAGCGMHVTLAPEGLAGAEVDEIASAEAHAGAQGTGIVVFFDIGDTLGRPVFGPTGQLLEIRLFAEVPEILKELTEKGARIGIISDPGSLDTGLIRSLLQDTGVLDFVEQGLVLFGPKTGPAIFDDAALAADTVPADCVFVGESQAERAVAAAVGFRVVATAGDVFATVDPDAAPAWVYLRDPKTKAGNAGPAPTASAQALDAFRDLVSLRGLTPPAAGANQELTGEYVKLENVEIPSPTIPTSPRPGDFRFSVNTNDFGAVNAYHNCDRLFRMLEDFGIDVRGYFDGSSFPVPVDHRIRFGDPPTANSVNASAPGHRFPTPASEGFRFALAARDTAVGMASDWRVVLHEFGHALLWDNVGSPNFRFAHSAGDAMAAILNDAGTRAPREATFPWVTIGRSHMRPVSDFAWFGTRFEPFDRFGADAAGYIAEQMLSSTLFRAYRAAGGDAASRQEQDFAARYVVFLIIKAIRLMTPFNTPERPDGFADLMMQADTGTFLHEGAPQQIGVLRKVIRWAFELQGAFRDPPEPGEFPTNRAGDPPPVDVYINDGRDGQYHFAENIDAVGLWNRQVSDGGTVHQDPVLGRTNFAFARVSNRGTGAASNLSVQGFQSGLPGGQVWPGDWQGLATPEVASAAAIPPGGEIILGPFAWVPFSSTPTLLMAVSASGDQSNLGRFSAANPVDTRRLALLDNNIATRRMTAVASPFAVPVG